MSRDWPSWPARQPRPREALPPRSRASAELSSDSPSIDRGILAHPALQPLHKLLWHLLRDAACPRQADLAKLLNVSRRGLQLAVRELRRQVLLIILPRAAGRGNRYVALAPPHSPERAGLLASILGPASPREPTDEELDRLFWYQSPQRLRW
ncbi:MAG: hypothetical protein AAB368_17770, partial [bacterium]